jgi:hypothetical protein
MTSVKIKLNQSAIKKLQQQLELQAGGNAMPPLTRDADKMICCLYKEYLTRRDHGISKRDSKRFTNEYFKSDIVLSKWQYADISDTKMELGQKKYLHVYIGDEFELDDNAIVYMENRFKNGLTEVIDIVSKFIP